MSSVDYYAITFNNELLYIGSSCKYKARIRKHKFFFNHPELCRWTLYEKLKTKTLDFNCLIFNIIHTKQMISNKNRFVFERELIKLLKPLYNCNNPIRDSDETDLQRAKKYYLEHKQEVLIKNNTKNICEKCGGKYTTINKLAHEKTLKHIYSE